MHVFQDRCFILGISFLFIIITNINHVMLIKAGGTEQGGTITKSTHACEHATIDLVDLQCPSNRYISVQNAIYGRIGKDICHSGEHNDWNYNCKADKSLDIVRTRCNGKHACSIKADNKVFGDPCRGTEKYLEVVYQCLATRIATTDHTCEGSTLNFQCDDNQYISVTNAIYGRIRKDICHSGEHNDWNYNCKAKQSYGIAKTRCNGKRSCSLVAGNDVFGDPCVGTEKYLEVEYKCVGTRIGGTFHACEHSTLELQCDDKQYISVRNAIYGRLGKDNCHSGEHNDWNYNCKADQSTNIVKSRCNGKRSCSIVAHNNVFGDPCQGTEKYLEVEYKCVSTKIEHIDHACEHSNVDLVCDDKHYISVQNAIYGRIGKDICHSGEHNDWNYNCKADKSLDIVRTRCNGKHTCSIKADNNVFGDPCRGTEKYVEVEYKCVGNKIYTPELSNRVISCEWDSVNLTCSSQKIIKILSANYGRTDQRICQTHHKNTNCIQPSSQAILSTRCDFKNECTVKADNSIFGDPCHGTQKYLEVYYKCVDAPTAPTVIPITENPLGNGSSYSTPQQRTDSNSLPESSVCGIQTATDRLLGGSHTQIGEFPWMALLKYKYTKDQTNAGFRCAGTLINKRHVLTAAHCLVGAFTDTLQFDSLVRLGEHDISNEIDCTPNTSECADPVKDVAVSKINPHKFYSPRSGNHDIGLLKLDIDITFTEFIRPICLPAANTMAPLNGIEMIVSGWGATENDAASALKLKIRIPIIDNRQCSIIMYIHRVRVTSNQVCAGGQEGVDACKGDSGGPLMALDTKYPGQQWYQEGIVSRGIGCGVKGIPGIYTKVSTYIQWILTNMKS